MAGNESHYILPRAEFDSVLVEGIQEQGVPVFFEHGVIDVEVGSAPRVSIETPGGERRDVSCRFIVDASGYGRVLPRLLDLDSLAGFETSNEPPAAMIAFPPFGPGGWTRMDPVSPESPFAGQFATIKVDGLNKTNGPTAATNKLHQR